MKILYIDHYAGSIDMGMEFRPFYLAREWQKMGHKVRIIGASFSHLRTKNPEVGYDLEKQVIDGIEYQWILTRDYQGNGVKRALSIFDFCSKLWSKSKEIVVDFKPNLIISSSTYPLDTYPAQRMAKLANAKLIHENHDLWPLTLETIGGMSHWHPFCLAMGMGLRSAIKNSDHIVCVLPFAFEYFRQYGLRDLSKFTHIPNGVVKEDWLEQGDIPLEHKVVFDSLKGRFVVGYAGGHAISNALDTLIECASRINDKRVAFVLVGKGVEKNRLIEKAKLLNCANVYFLPSVSKKQIPSVLEKMDVMYVGSEKSELLKYGASLNKLYDYMMAAKPIIYGVNSRNKEVEEAGCGWIVESENIDMLKKQIIATSSMGSKELAEMGNRGKNWVLQNCDYKVLASKFIESIQ